MSSATGWSSFGYALSGGMDLDQNAYPDLLVGSYQDNKVGYGNFFVLLLSVYQRFSLNINISKFSNNFYMSLLHLDLSV